MIKAKFNLIEINNPLVKRENLDHRIFRYIIRFGIYINLVYCSFFFRFLNFAGSFFKNDICNLIKINEFFFTYILHIKNNRFNDAIFIKKSWAQYIINSKKIDTTDSIRFAHIYLDVIKSCNDQPSQIVRKNCHIINPIFYVYGPNSKIKPDVNLNKSFLVLTKFPTFDVSMFPKRIIFLNNYVLSTTNSTTLRRLTKDYFKVFIPYGKFCFANNVYEMPKFTLSNLASPMGLSRLIVTLKHHVKNATFYFEGFDFGLSKKGYSGNILTGFDFEKINEFERQYCLSLTIHDFIFNFLYTKAILKNSKFYGTKMFVRIINMNLKNYLKGISKARNFSCI